MKKNRVTIHDIAKELNTTASTVSRALQDHPRISKAMKTAVTELANRLNYQPNSIASSLRKGKGNTIGVIIPRIDRYFFASVIRGIEDVAYEAGYNILICQSYDSFEREKKIVDTLTNGKVDGLLVSVATGTIDFKHFEAVQNKGIPIIFFDRIPESLDSDKVEIDDFSGAFNAVEHLILQGCKRIVHFSGLRHVSIYRKRYEGYKAALERYHITFDANLVFDNVVTRESGENAAIKISEMTPRPDGIFSAGDFSALGAIIKMKSLGIDIPKDIAVIGFANEPYDDMVEPGLSSVDQHSAEMGHCVANLFLEQISDNSTLLKHKQILLNPSIVKRASSLRNPD